MSQWLTLRSTLSGWRTASQNFGKGLVGLNSQSGLSAHPLPMESFNQPMGLEPIGGIDTGLSISSLAIIKYREL